MMRSCLALVLVAVTVAVSGCGETANTIGQVSNEGGTSTGGSPAGGSAAASGAANGGSASGGAGGTASGGTASGGVASGGSAVGGGGGVSSLQCDEPQALDGNWEMCGGARTLHRPTPGKCTFTPSNAVLRPTGNDDQCLKDSDCTAQPLGMCRTSSGISGSVNYCDYGCELDSDCDAGSICVCADTSISSFGSWGVARAGSCQRIANCMSDQDCPGGNWCAPYDSNPGCYSPVFACTTAQDECTKPSDCAGFPHESCTFDGTRRVCQAAGCVVD
jgi:hypothetical protein